jgi:hypothetical protein
MPIVRCYTASLRRVCGDAIDAPGRWLVGSKGDILFFLSYCSWLLPPGGVRGYYGLLGSARGLTRDA